MTKHRHYSCIACLIATLALHAEVVLGQTTYLEAVQKRQICEHFGTLGAEWFTKKTVMGLPLEKFKADAKKGKIPRQLVSDIIVHVMTVPKVAGATTEDEARELAWASCMDDN